MTSKFEERRTSIAQLWKTIENQLGKTAPLIRQSLNPPAKASALAKLENSLGLKLPAELRESLLIHDGQEFVVTVREGKAKRKVAVWFTEADILLSVNAMLANVELMRDLAKDDLFDVYREDWPRLKKDSRIKHAQYWNTNWIPFTTAEGDGFCIDLDPAPRGSIGQVFYFCRGDHWPRADGIVPWQVLAPDYTAWLARYAQLLKKSKLDPDFGGGALQTTPRGAIYKRARS